MPHDHLSDTRSRHVFVYGTLRRTGSNDINRQHPAPRWVGLACVAGTLYDLGAYPGMSLAPQPEAGVGGGNGNGNGNGNGDVGGVDGRPAAGEVTHARTPAPGWVLGEVYAISPALERVLDDIEGLGADPIDEYVKREVWVEVAGQRLQCLVYEINPRYVQRAPVLAQGDWLLAAPGARERSGEGDAKIEV